MPIKNASVEQSDGIGQVNNAIQQMDQVTQENAANAEETASASEVMTAQTENLMDQIKTLASLVGGTGSEGVCTVKKPIRGTSTQAIPGVKKVEQVRKVKPDGNAHSDEKVPLNADFEAVIPMSENRVSEYEGDFNGF